jgi:hypothetical protein
MRNIKASRRIHREKSRGAVAAAAAAITARGEKTWNGL